MISEQSILELIFQTSQGSINVSLIIILLAIGYFLKHAVKKLSNDNIPWILLILGIVLALVINVPYGPDMIVTYVIQGIVSGAAAVGLHTNGKTILNIFNFGKSPAVSDKDSEESDQ